MQQLYSVELTEPAERAYLQLHEKAQAQIEAGCDDHADVAAFNAVENAIDTTLAFDPCDQHRCLGGRLSSIFRLRLGSVSILYTTLGPVTIVLTIEPAEANRPIRRRLSKAIDTGELDGLMETIGLANPCSKVQISSRLPN